MSGGGQRLQGLAYCRGNPSQRLELRFVAIEFRPGGELLVDQQMGDLLELACVRDLENVVSAVMQVIAGDPYRAQRGVARRYSGECDRFLGFGSGGERVGHWEPRSKLTSRLSTGESTHAPSSLQIVVKVHLAIFTTVRPVTLPSRWTAKAPGSSSKAIVRVTMRSRCRGRKSVAIRFHTSRRAGRRVAEELMPSRLTPRRINGITVVLSSA